MVLTNLLTNKQPFPNPKHFFGWLTEAVNRPSSSQSRPCVDLTYALDIAYAKEQQAYYVYIFFKKKNNYFLARECSCSNTKQSQIEIYIFLLSGLKQFYNYCLHTICAAERERGLWLSIIIIIKCDLVHQKNV